MSRLTRMMLSPVIAQRIRPASGMYGSVWPAHVWDGVWETWRRTQSEKNLCAALLDAHAGHLQHLLQGHVAPAPGHWRPRERAVAAGVSAEPRKRCEDLQHLIC